MKCLVKDCEQEAIDGGNYCQFHKLSPGMILKNRDDLVDSDRTVCFEFEPPKARKAKKSGDKNLI